MLSFGHTLPNPSQGGQPWCTSPSAKSSMRSTRGTEVISLWSFELAGRSRRPEVEPAAPSIPPSSLANSSWIFTEQCHGQWHDTRSDSPLADATLDRLDNKAHRIYAGEAFVRKRHASLKTPQPDRRSGTESRCWHSARHHEHRAGSQLRRPGSSRTLSLKN